MRGRIIQYNSAEGSGIIAAGSEQHPFVIAKWRAETAPEINRTVEFELHEDAVTEVKPVAAEAIDPGQIGSAAVDRLSGFGDRLAASDGGTSWVLPIGRLGRIGLVVWLVFVVAAMFLSYFTVKEFGMMGGMFGRGTSPGISLFSILQVSDSTSFNGGRLLFLIALIGGALPIFWRSPYAWLGLLLPLIADQVIGLRLASVAKEMGGGYVDFNEMLSPGIGWYLVKASTIALGVVGILRFLSARKAMAAS